MVEGGDGFGALPSQVRGVVVGGRAGHGARGQRRGAPRGPQNSPQHGLEGKKWVKKGILGEFGDAGGDIEVCGGLIGTLSPQFFPKNAPKGLGATLFPSILPQKCAQGSQDPRFPHSSAPKMHPRVSG